MNILLLSSSVREDRNTHQLAKALEKRINSEYNHDAKLIDLKETDLQNLGYLYKKHPNPPEKMKAAYDEFMATDAFIFVSPEYNGSYSGALKNAVDHFPKSAYQRKPIGVATVSTGAMGGMRAALQMQLLVLALKGIPSPEMLLTPNVSDKFKDGKLVDTDFLKNIDRFLDHLFWLSEKIS